VLGAAPQTQTRKVGFLGGFWRGFDGFEAVSGNHPGILRLEETSERALKYFVLVINLMNSLGRLEMFKEIIDYFKSD
jgi:hypothetical protein